MNTLDINKIFIKNSDIFTYKVVASAETEYSDIVKQNVCIINVYKDDKMLPIFFCILVFCWMLANLFFYICVFCWIFE